MSSVLSAVRPTTRALTGHHPVDGTAVTLLPGFLRELVERNRARTLPHGAAQLVKGGNLANFQAVMDGGSYSGGTDDSGAVFPFLDSDVYKWLEAAGWELAAADDPELRASAEEMIGLIRGAQRADGYVNTYVELATPGQEFQDLRWAHELYSIGHLIQAAVAWKRALDDDRLLEVACRAADRVDAEFGPDGRDGTDGHPEIEMALVELYRITDQRRYLDLAARLLDARGHGLLGNDRFGSRYWQDHEPVRSAATPTGHAVRQLYLDCGAVDIAVETGDGKLLAAVIRRWEDTVATRTYLTGAVGAHHRDESFGDPFELPADRAYAETCAAIASVMLSWRLLLATGEARFADVAERALYNAVLAGISLEGTEFFYVNPLHRRTGHENSGEAAASVTRAPWFACACCPPNLMRLFASLNQQLFTTTPDTLYLHHFTSARVENPMAGGTLAVGITTGYPFDGGVSLQVEAAPADEVGIAVRMPSWCRRATVTVNGEAVSAPLSAKGFVTVRRGWVAGDVLAVDFDLAVRVTVGDQHIDAIRGCAAIERGPLVYCLEQADLLPGQVLEDIALSLPAEPAVVTAPGFGSPLPAIEVNAAALPSRRHAWPYGDAGDTGVLLEKPEDSVAQPASRQRLIPYFAWANRTPGPMRVWIPIATSS